MGSHGFTISDSHFTNNAYYVSENRDSDTSSVSVYPRHKLRNWGVVRTRKNWTFNSAVAEKEGSGESVPVFVQTFEGRGAKQLFADTLEFSRGLVNGHHLNVIGISPNSTTEADSHYIVYERAHSRDSRRLLAAALMKGEKETTIMGLRTVYGITSALAYLSKVASSISLAQIEAENFDAFSDDSGRTMLCFTPNIVNTDMIKHPNGLPNRNDLDLCNSLIGKIFTEANHTIWSDEKNLTDIIQLPGQSPVRLIIIRVVTVVTAIKVKVLQSNCLKHQKSLDLPLSDISEVYGDFLLDSPFDASSSVPELPRRLGKGITSHKCKGYCREEVTFTPDAFKNTVVVFREPSLNERCLLCGTVITIEESLLASRRVIAASGPPVTVKVHFHEDIFIIQVSRVIEYDELVEKVGRKIRLSAPRRADGPIREQQRKFKRPLNNINQEDK
ncbi:hypothetical protein BDP27DRAFT_1424578 [Rhodocollybia butyracea]|uniref:Peptidase S50 domain-containing protein n=1 Tax=Rhodocollybia butyracea TaxID=206335 RepID=A0A9P5PM58_9AGAR|nr:hypothetical protein BDP27DRAFT_1424578 [Rhodocollybia butyracea]